MKRGGSKMGYTAQFDLLSPCYKEGEHRASDFRIGGAKAKPTKKEKPTKKAAKAKNPKKTNKQRGGSSCYASPSVSEMGIVDKPASLEPTKSELAWDNRMKGGDLPLVGNVKPNPTNVKPNPTNVKPNPTNVKPNPTNLFSRNLSSVNNKNPIANSTKSLVNTMTPTVNSNNSPLNKIKNDLFPEGTTPELVMKLIQTNKNLTNPSDSTYSFEIFYRLDGKNEIQKSSKSNVKFREFLNEYHTISEQVFPRPPKAVGVLNENANAKAKAAANAAAKAAANANAAATLFGGRKPKNNHK